MKKIKLRKASWEYNPSILLGPPGGFGSVFRGVGEDGQEVAVKKLHSAPASTGNRELVISEELEGKSLSHIIPFYDSGIDAESIEYFVVMAKAERSLQQLLEGGPISEQETTTVLRDIALGLREAESFVHRDLKPGNVLYHEGKWKLADFGIARFIEESTSLNTLKNCLSPAFAAPEQWKLDRATKATDVYAFGCIAVALLTGKPPFPSENARDCHLHNDPPKIDASPKMQQLISLCLRKHPNARPSVESVLKQIDSMKKIATSPNNLIESAGAVVATQEAKKEAEAYHKQMIENDRMELAKEAINNLNLIVEDMFKTIKKGAMVSKEIPDGIKLGSGKLQFKIVFPFLVKDDFPNSEKNIVCGALISVEQEDSSYLGRSANLWFGEYTEGEFRWWETSYFHIAKRISQYKPFGVSRSGELYYADEASASHLSSSIQHATNPKPIDCEYAEEFKTRWINRLALASSKTLQKPRMLPEA